MTTGQTYQYRVVFADGTSPPLPNLENTEGMASADIPPVTLQFGAGPPPDEDMVDLANVPTAPIILDPPNPAIDTYTSRNIYRSNDGGVTYNFVGTIPDFRHEI